jgi:hypothetical protein
VRPWYQAEGQSDAELAYVEAARELAPPGAGVAPMMLGHCVVPEAAANACYEFWAGRSG